MWHRILICILGVMVTNLYHNCSFVRVLPWRYTAKKGFGGSSLITNTSPLWTYDWATHLPPRPILNTSP